MREIRSAEITFIFPVLLYWIQRQTLRLKESGRRKVETQDQISLFFFLSNPMSVAQRIKFSSNFWPVNKAAEFKTLCTFMPDQTNPATIICQLTYLIAQHWVHTFHENTNVSWMGGGVRTNNLFLTLKRWIEGKNNSDPF